MLEVRHPSFRTAELCELLRTHGVGMVVADSAGTWPMFDEATSDVAYVRLHGGTELYASGYSAPALDRWAEKVRGWEADGLDVFVYFDNDARSTHPSTRWPSRSGWASHPGSREPRRASGDLELPH